MVDQKYIKMILALDEEFFEGWEWNDGDQVYLSEDIDEYTCSEDHGLYTVFDGLLANDGFLNTENWLYVRAIDFKNGRPIPSQEQLQEMINLTPAKYIDDLYNYTNEPTPENTDQSIFFINVKCFTLAYVMDRKYGKYWNGESWEKDE